MSSQKESQEIEFQSLEIKDLSFRFPGRKQILGSINISIKKGEIISIIGESGSGKTTLGYVLQKFYSPESGSIFLNDKISIQDVNTNSWRNIIGVVPQEIHIFNGNVLDNICLGDTQKEAENVLKFIAGFGFEKYIAGFPQGVLTILGEEGINLSGGQKQVIALARALYRNPQVLILDEATAAMDRETEKFTIDLLNKLKKNIAVFYISHRLHVLKNISDKIYILKDGNIQDSGTHDELLLTDNMYSSYWKELACV